MLDLLGFLGKFFPARVFCFLLQKPGSKNYQNFTRAAFILFFYLLESGFYIQEAADSPTITIRSFVHSFI